MTLSGTCINLFIAMRNCRFKSLGKYFIQAFILISFIFGCAALIFIEAARISSQRKKILYLPRNWASTSMLARIGEETASGGSQDYPIAIGGGSLSILPLDIKRYQVKPGDSLSEIAYRFGMDLDTIASLNREWGSGVHLITVGEEIKIPNQDGIFLVVEGSLEATCAGKNVPPEVVLQVNRVSRESFKAGMELFFPGVQHTGIERSVMTGTAFLKPVWGFISSGFGYRRDPFTKEMKFHRGIDFAAPVGDVIRAALDGSVISVGYDPIFGKHIMIKHQIGYTSLYGHLHSISVKNGALVRRGQQIGLVGNTGRSTGSHLHFELRKKGVPIDPAGLISRIY